MKNFRASFPAISRLRLFALFLVVVGARFWLIRQYALPVPTADEWDGIGVFLLQRWQDGVLGWRDFFVPHNEHRIVLTRLISLALIVINGQWDTLLTSSVNAVFCGGSAVFMAKIFGDCLRGAFPRAVLLAVALCFVLPFGWENTLGGFQSQNYFLIFFSVLGVWGMGSHRLGSGRWWLGLAGVVLACLSMGSGLLAAGVVLVQRGWRLLRERRWPDAGEIVTAALCLGIVVAGCLTRVNVPGHAALKAGSFPAFLSALGRFLAWPNYDTAALGILTIAPTAWLAWVTFRRAPDGIVPRVEPLFAIGFWAALQTAALAYTREAHGLPPACRYMDLLALNPLVGFLCLLALIARWREPARRGPLVAVTALWTLVVLVGLRAETVKDFRNWMPDRLALLRRGEQNLRVFLRTGNRADLLTDREAAEALFPEPERLPDIAASPKLQALLPYDIRLPLPLREIGGSEPPVFVPGGFPTAVGNAPEGEVWGSDGQGQQGKEGTFRARLSSPTALPYLRFSFAGDLGEAGLRFSLSDLSGGRRIVWQPARIARDHWRADYLPKPGRELRLEADDASATRWFAFSAPVEVGRWSYWTGYVLRRSEFIVAAGLLLAVGLEIVWLTNARRRG